MEQRTAQVLIADDDPLVVRQVVEALKDAPDSRVTPAHGEEEILDAVRRGCVDLLFLDTGGPDAKPDEALRQFRAIKKDSPSTLVVLTSAHPTVEAAIVALRSGVYDFLVKPIRPEEVAATVDRALRLRRMGEERRRSLEQLDSERAKVAELSRLVRDRLGFDNALGGSAAIQPVYRILEEVCRTDSTVLLTGESGTGKGVVARMIHAHSPRTDRPFVEANCVVYSEGVLGSELFGHEKGAFTGAARRKRGRFEMAEGGTIFLDEIGEIGGSIQLMLLRFLQEHKFERVGGEETLEVDARVIAATNRNLEAAMEAGAFRRDLFYRLNVIPIEIPPLRERREDIPFLVRKILVRCAETLSRPCEGIRSDALEALVRHDWPGNIRELENVLERTLVLSSAPEIRFEDLPEPFWISGPPRPSGESLRDRERAHIIEVLRRYKGNKKAAARWLGIHRSSLYSKIRRFAIDPEELRN